MEKQLQNKGRSECGTDIKDELHEECGVFGAYNLKGEDIANWVYYGLFLCSIAGRKAAASQSVRTVISDTIKTWDLSVKFYTGESGQASW